MTTIERINKLISEYRLKIADCDFQLQAAREDKKQFRGNGWDLSTVNEDIAKLNTKRQAYVTIIADLEGIVDLGDEVTG